MPNEIEILKNLIRLAKEGDHDAAEQLRKILVAEVNAADLGRVTEMAGYVLVIKQAESRQAAGAK